jgi:DNA end-binding protein Ku
VWRGDILVGDVALPVRLFAGPRDDLPENHQLHKPCASRIKQVIYCAAEDKPIPRSEIVKTFEVPALAQTPARVVATVRHLDTARIESTYYVWPEADEKTYAGLLNVLKRLSVAAIVDRIPLKRPRPAAILAGPTGLILHTLFYEREMRRLTEFRTAADPEPGFYRPLRALMTPEIPEFPDDYFTALEAEIAKGSK